MIVLIMLDFLLGAGLFVLALNTPDKVLRWLAFSGVTIEIVAGIIGILLK